MKGATFNYDVDTGIDGESAFEFKGQLRQVPRITPPPPDKLAQPSQPFWLPNPFLYIATIRPARSALPYRRSRALPDHSDRH